MLIAFVILVIAVALCSGHLCNHIPPPQSEVSVKSQNCRYVSDN